MRTVGLRGVARADRAALIASEGRMPKRASIERPEGRMPGGSVRRDGTGNPEPASLSTLRASGHPRACLHPAANFVRRAFTTGAGTNFKSASSSASGVICLSNDDEMCE